MAARRKQRPEPDTYRVYYQGPDARGRLAWIDDRVRGYSADQIRDELRRRGATSISFVQREEANRSGRSTQRVIAGQRHDAIGVSPFAKPTHQIIAGDRADRRVHHVDLASARYRVAIVQAIKKNHRISSRFAIALVDEIPEDLIATMMQRGVGSAVAASRIVANWQEAQRPSVVARAKSMPNYARGRRRNRCGCGGK